MAFPERNLVSKCIYWGNPVPDGFGGFTYDEPVELDCSWVASTRVMVDRSGRELVSRAQVRVAQDLDEQGMLYLGVLDDLDSAEELDPRSVAGAWEIKRFDRVPTIKGTAYYRVAYL